MATPCRAWKAAAAVLIAALVALGWWQHRAAVPAAGMGPQGSGQPPIAPGRLQDRPGHWPGVAAGQFDPRLGASAPSLADPLLTPDLRHTLEDLLLQAEGTSDPSSLKQVLAGLIGQRFPPALAARALALSERYVDYRVALGGWRAPQDPTDPALLRAALEARQALRRQFFDDAEYQALFAREVEQDRYTLARLQAIRNPHLTPAQRIRALQATEQILPQERLAERKAATEHLAAAAQTAALHSQNADSHQRHAARSARYGEAAAHALAELDREEHAWQQRLDLYLQARSGNRRAAQLLHQQPFSQEELLRVDAALALRQLQATMPHR